MENAKMNQNNNGNDSIKKENRSDTLPSANIHPAQALAHYESTSNNQNSFPQDEYSSNYTGTSSYSNNLNSYDRPNAYGYNRSSSNLSYGGGYNSYANNNQYSSYYNNQPGQINDPMLQQGPKGPQMPMCTFRTDFWGVLNGFNCVLNILYAGSGLVNYGKIFAQMSLKVIKLVCGKSFGLIMRITGIEFLKKLLFGSNKSLWTEEFGAPSLLAAVWSDVNEGAMTKTSIFAKFVHALRICCLLGALMLFFLRRKMADGRIYAEQIETSRMNNADIIEVNQITQEMLGKDSEEIMNNEAEQPLIKNEEIQKEQETINSQSEFSPTEIMAETVESEVPVNRLEIKKVSSKDYIEMKDMTKTNKVEKKSQDIEEIKCTTIDNQSLKIFSNFEEMKKSLISDREKSVEICDETPNLAAKTEMTLPVTIEPRKAEALTITDGSSNDIRSEDFWKKKALENSNQAADASLISHADSMKEIVHEFQEPSMLKNLNRSSSIGTAGKLPLPWLKKQKTAVN